MNGCSDNTEPVQLGALYNLTGTQSDLDVPSAHGAGLAVDQLNSRGGVLNRPIELLLQNGETTPAVITQETVDLFAGHHNVTALLGFSDTDMVLAAAPTAAAHQRVFITSGATSPLLPEQVPEYLFLACFGDNVQAAAGAEWAYHNLSARTVAVLYNADMDYTRLLHQYFQQRFTELGGKVLAEQSYRFADDVNALNDIIADLPAADLLYLASSPSDDLRLVQLLRAAGITAPILGGDSLDAEELWQKNPDVDNVYYTTHVYLSADNPDPQVQAFYRDYHAAYGTNLSAFAALGYDTVNLLANAIERAGSDDPQAVRAALAQTKDFRGVSGTISYIDGSRIPSKSVSILEAKDGDVQLITTLLPTDVPAPDSASESDG